MDSTTTYSPDNPFAQTSSQYSPDNPFAPKAQAAPSGPPSLGQQAINTLASGQLGPGASLLGALANTVTGGPLQPADIVLHGLSQGWDDKAIAAIKGLGQTVSGSGSLADNYKSALQDLVTRRQGGMEGFGIAGKGLEMAAGAVPYIAAGGLVPGPTSIAGKLAASTGAGAGAAAIQAAGEAPAGQEIPAAGKGALIGGAFGLAGGLTGMAGAALWKKFVGPQNPEQAAIEWLKTTGAFDGDIQQYEAQLSRRLAKLPPDAQTTILAQLGDEKLSRDLLVKVAKQSKKGAAIFEKVADEHGAMADPFYAKAFQQAVPLSDVQATILAEEPAAQVAWKRAVQQFPGLPDPQPGAQVPVPVMDFVKRQMDDLVGGTQEYVTRANLRILRDALIQPVKAQVPDYAKATAISSVEQSLRAAIVASKKQANTVAAKGGLAFPNPVPEATIGVFLQLIHGNPAWAATIYGLRVAANLARRASGWARDRDLAAGAQLLVQPAGEALRKIAAPAAIPTAALHLGSGAAGGGLGALLVPADSSQP